MAGDCLHPRRRRFALVPPDDGAPDVLRARLSRAATLTFFVAARLRYPRHARALRMCARRKNPQAIRPQRLPSAFLCAEGLTMFSLFLLAVEQLTLEVHL